MLLQFARYMKDQGGQVGAVQWVGWGSEMALEAGDLLLLPGLEKSHCMLLQVPEEIWKLCGKRKD
jgi:hypothetical protein